MSKIEWLQGGKTWNPITGCPGPKVSPGCANCYAEKLATTRLRGRCGYDAEDPFKVTFHAERMKMPIGWRKPTRIFVGSMGDMFHSDVLYRDLDLVLAVAALTPQHTYMLLTKRPDLMRRYMVEERRGNPVVSMDEGYTSCAIEDITRRVGNSDRQWRYFSGVPGWKVIKPDWPYQWPLPNVWLGVTVCGQDEIWKIEALESIPAARRYVSFEPLLGPVDAGFTRAPTDRDYQGWNGDGPIDQVITARADKIHLVIVGGESGPGARPMHPDWVRSLRAQCRDAGVPFFFKGWGKWLLKDDYACSLLPHTGATRDWEKNTAYYTSMSKSRAGRLLDGQEWNEMPPA